MILKEILNVYETKFGQLFIELIFEDNDGIEQHVPSYVYTIDADSEIGLAPQIKEWLENNEIDYLPYVEPEYKEPIPDVVNRRQFFQQLALSEVITKQEAINAIANGKLPQAVESVIDQIEDEDDKFNAQMILIGGSEFERLHPLTDKIKAMVNWSDEDRDNFWLSASKL